MSRKVCALYWNRWRWRFRIFAPAKEPFIPNNLILHPFRGDDDYSRLAYIIKASENTDSLPVTVSATDLAVRWKSSPRFDLDRDLIIAEVDGQDVGFGRVRWSDEPSRRTYGLHGFIIPEWRRKGIGRALLGWLEERTRVLSGENLNNYKLYASCGFQEVKRDTVYEKPLSN